MVAEIFEQAGIKTGTIGTLGIVYNGETIKTDNTTPESYEIQKAMRDMINAGCKAMVIEASSIGLKHHRLAGMTFDVAIFTNFSDDHIGGVEHKDMAEYLYCKSLLFRQCKLGIVNGDDPYADRILEGSTCQVERYGLQPENDLYAENLQLADKPGELGICFDAKGILTLSCEVPTPGRFSVYNALAAIAICHHFGVSPDDIE